MQGDNDIGKHAIKSTKQSFPFNFFSYFATANFSRMFSGKPGIFYGRRTF